MPYPESHPDSCLQFYTRSAAETQKLGRHLGKILKNTAVIALIGDLGAGKTGLVQGLARGLGVPDTVPITSPTYTIINEYTGRLPLFHVDLYRISDPEELEDIGFDDILTGMHVVAIEWAERMAEDEPPPDILIRMVPEGDTGRRISIFFYGPDISNLIEGMKQFHQQQGA